MHQNSISTLNYNFYFEILLRVFLVMLHFWSKRFPPMMREIKPNEIWLYQYPITKSYVSLAKLHTIITLSPTIVLCLDYIFHKNINDVIRGSLAYTLSLGLTGCITSLLKIMIGRPRPDFYYRCFPNGDGADINKCTGSLNAVSNGRKSFPSGHSALALCCAAFITLYLIRSFRFLSKSAGGKSWKLCVLILPILGGITIALSRTWDYHHHYEDIIAGSLLGSLMSYIVFKMYFNQAIDSHCKCLKKKYTK